MTIDFFHNKAIPSCIKYGTVDGLPFEFLLVGQMTVFLKWHVLFLKSISGESII